MGVDETSALIISLLAPFAACHDIAMLGVIHRSKCSWTAWLTFERHEHINILVGSRTTTKSPLGKGSALGLAAIDNLLQPAVWAAKLVAVFQKGYT